MAGTQGSSYSSPSAAATANRNITSNLNAGLNPSGSSRTAASYGTGGGSSVNAAAAAAAARAAAASRSMAGSSGGGFGGGGSPMGAAMGGFGGGFGGRTTDTAGINSANRSTLGANAASPMGAAMGGFGSASFGGAQSPMSNSRNMGGQQAPSGAPMGAAMGGFGAPQSNNIAQVAKPSLPDGFSQAQFGAQQFAPGDMYKNPLAQGAALRSVINGIQLQGGTPQQQLDALYRNMGYNPAARAGMIGAFQHESANFAPSVLNGTQMGDAGTAYGLGQWRDYTNPRTGATDPRMTNAQNYVSGMGLPANSLLGQGAFGGTELANSYPGVMEKLQGSTTPAQAAEAMIGYEKPAGYTGYLKSGDPSNVAGWGDRLANANQAFGIGSPSGGGAAPSVQVASAQPPQGPLTSRVVGDRLETYYPGAQTPAGSPQPAAIAGTEPSLWEKIQNKVNSGIDTASTAATQIQQGIDQVPGTPQQQAQVVKDWMNGNYVGAGAGYVSGLLGDATKPIADQLNKVDKYFGGDGSGGTAVNAGIGSPDRQNLASEKTRNEARGLAKNEEFKSLSPEDKAEVRKLVKGGMSIADAIKKVKGGSTGTGGGTGGPTQIAYPTYYTNWMAMPKGPYA